MGVWYNIESYPQFFREGTCSRTSYGLTEEGINIFNTQVVDETLDSVIGLAVTDPSETGEARLTVSFHIPEWNCKQYSNYYLQLVRLEKTILKCANFFLKQSLGKILT